MNVISFGNVISQHTHFFWEIIAGRLLNSGVSSMGVHPQILADQLTLSQPGGTDYAHLITTGTPGFSDLPTALLKDMVSDLFESMHSPS